MPEELLDVLGLWTLREEQRGAGVPQVVDRIRGKPARLRSEANESLCKLFGLLRVPTSLAKTRGARGGASCSGFVAAKWALEAGASLAGMRSE